MAEISKALSDAIDTTQTKQFRLSTFASLHTNLGQKERLRDVLDAVRSKWKRLTEMFFLERDDELVRALSGFLAETGKVAILYGRFSGSSIDPVIYVAWIQQHICKKEISSEQRALLLKGLTDCLSDLESSAFKSVAPSLLRSCCMLLDQNETPMTLFEPILGAMQLLCKVSSAVRDQFVIVVDLILGWGSCPETPFETAPLILAVFRQMASSWEKQPMHGTKLIMSIMDDLRQLLEAQLPKDDDVRVFINTSTCLVAIFDCCCPYLPLDMLTHPLGHIRYLLRSLSFIPSVVSDSDSLKQYMQYMEQLFSRLVRILINRSVPSAISLITQSFFEAMADDQNSPETLAVIVLLHTAFLQILLREQTTLGTDRLLWEVYGENSIIYDLRTSQWKPLVMKIKQLYSILLEESAEGTRQLFGSLFAQDLRPTVIGNVSNQMQHFASGGQYQTIRAFSTAEHQNMTSDSVPVPPIVAKQQLFALTLFHDCLSDGRSPDDIAIIIQHAVRDSRKWLQHPLAMQLSLKILSTLWSRESLSLKDAIGDILHYIDHVSFKEDDAVSAATLSWLENVVEGLSPKQSLTVDLETRLLKMIVEEERVGVLGALITVLHKTIRNSVDLNYKEAFLRWFFQLASHTSSDISEKALSAIRDCGMYCTNRSGDSSDEVETQSVAIALQPPIYSFRSSQLALFLKKLTSGTMPKRDAESSTGWITRLSQELSSTVSTDLSDDEIIVKIEDTVLVYRKAHILAHEAAKFIVMTKFRSIESGPSRLLKLTTDRLSELKEQLENKKPVDTFHVWLLFEFMAALQKQTFCGYDGAYVTRSPPPSTWAYYASNRNSFEEGFNQLRYKQLVVSHRCGFHKHAAAVGCLFLKHQSQKIIKNVTDLQQLITPKQTMLKTRQKPPDEGVDSLLHMIRQFVDGIQLTCLSLIEINAAANITGLQMALEETIDFSMSVFTENSACTGFLSWMEACAFEARHGYEQASTIYRCCHSQMNDLLETLRNGSESELPSRSIVVVEKIRAFVLERRMICYSRVMDWERFELIDKLVDVDSLQTISSVQLQCMGAEMLCDAGRLEEAREQMKTWQSQSYEVIDSGINTVSGITALQARLQTEATELPMAADTLRRHRHLLSFTDQEKMLQLMHLVNVAEQNTAAALLAPLRKENDGNVWMSVLPLVFPELSSNASAADYLQVDPQRIRHLKHLALRLDDPETKGIMTLLHMHAAIEAENYGSAARGWESMASDLQSFPNWLRLAFNAQRCKLMLVDTKEGTDWCKQLSEYWTILLQSLRTMGNPQEEPASAQIMSLWLVRFVQCLRVQKQNATIDAALLSIDIPDFSQIVQSRYYQQLQEVDCVDGRPRTARSVQLQLSCISLALEIDGISAKAWKQFSEILLISSTASTQQNAVLHNSAIALCKCLQYSHSEKDSLEALVDLFSLLKGNQTELLVESVTSEILSIPSSVWKPLSGQLFSLIGTSDRNLSRCIAKILTGLFDVAWSSLFYSVLEEWTKENRESQYPLPEVEMLVHHFQQHHPRLIPDATLLIEELHRLNSLLSEDWQTIWTDAHVESQLRLSVLNEEARRIGSEHSDNDERCVLLKQAHDLVMLPLAKTVRKTMEKKRHNFASTPFEQRYWQKFGSRFEAFLESLEAPLDDGTLSEIQERWRNWKILLKEVIDEVKTPLPPLQQISPALMALQNTHLPIPGIESRDVFLSHFGPKIEVLSTKTRPKKLTLIGSDGRAYSFLLKGKEDLHIDEHLLQLIRLMNTILAAPDVRVPRVYSVTPLGDRIGLIQWVDRTVSFFALLRQWQSRQQKKLKEWTLQSQSKSKTIPTTVTNHPKEVFQKFLLNALTEADIPRTTSRNAIPINVLRTVFDRLQSESPVELLSNEIWGMSSNFADMWKKTQIFTQSTALGSVMCYVLGIGDRHLDNMLLDVRTAEAINIDFNLCFGCGEKLRVPEIVLFRLTRVIQAAMGFGGVQGLFQKMFTSSLDVLRQHQRCLVGFLEAILTDPVMDWTVERTKRAFHQNLEIALHLKLLLNRIDVTEISNHCVSLESIRDASLSLIETSKQAKSLFQRRQSQQALLIEAEQLLNATFSHESESRMEDLRQKDLIDTCSQTLQEMQGTLDHILKLNRSWCYRHGRLLLAILDQTEGLLLLSEEQWNSASAPCAMDFINASTPVTVLGLLFRDHSPPELLPADLSEECLAVDQQRDVVDAAREGRFVKMFEAMYTYVLIIRRVFSKDHICSSHHYQWMRVFEQAKAKESITDSLPSISDTGVNRHELHQMYKTLSNAYTTVQQRIEACLSTESSDHLTNMEEIAIAKIIPIQRCISAGGWNPTSFHLILQRVCQRFVDVISTEADEPHSVVQWLVWILGLAQILRLFRSSSTHQELLSQMDDANGAVMTKNSVSTGFAWLDSVERYISEVMIIVENIKNGALIDVTSFMKSDLVAKGKELAEHFGQYWQRINQIRERMWMVYDSQSSTTDQSLKSVRISESLSLGGASDRCDSTNTGLENEVDNLMMELETLCQEFIQELCGLTQKVVRIENNEDAIDLEITSQLWGQMKFPLLHALFKVFELYEAADNEISPFCSSISTDSNTCREGFPPSTQKLNSWLDNMKLTASLMQSMYQQMTVDSATSTNMASLVEQHYALVLAKKIQPLVISKIETIINSIQTTQTDDDAKSMMQGVQEDVDRVWKCLCAQGAFAEAKLIAQSTMSWAKSEHADQVTRLRHLAAFEWCYSSDLAPPGIVVDKYLKQYLEQQQLFIETPSISRTAILQQMRTEAESLLDMNAMVERCEADGEAVAFKLNQHLISALQGCSDEEKSIQLIETLQTLIQQRRNWRRGARQHIADLTQIVQTILQFEFSRSAQTWNPGDDPTAESFVNFRKWIDEFCRLTADMESAKGSVRQRHGVMESQLAQITEQRLAKEQHQLELTTVTSALSEAVRILDSASRTLVSAAAQVNQHWPRTRSTLSDTLGPWANRLSKLSEGNKHSIDITTRALHCCTIYELLAKHYDQTCSFPYNSAVEPVHKALIEYEKQPKSDIHSNNAAPILMLEEAYLKGIQDAGTVANQEAVDLRQFVEAVLELKRFVQETLLEPIAETDDNEKTTTTNVQSDGVWISTEGLSQMESECASDHDGYATSSSDQSTGTIAQASTASSSGTVLPMMLTALPRLSRPLTAQQLEYADRIKEDFKRRLSGLKLHRQTQQSEETEDNVLSTAEMTECLIKQTTDEDNLCQMFEGWMPWI